MYALNKSNVGPAGGQAHRTSTARLPPAPSVTLFGAYISAFIVVRHYF